MRPGDFFLVRLHPHDFRSLVAFEDEGYEVRDRITHYNRDFTEDFWLLRSPPDGSFVNNVLRHGVGALNIDACRLTTSDNLNGGAYSKSRAPRAMNPNGKGDRQTVVEAPYEQPTGRWPAHVVLSHNEDCGDECTEGCVIAALDKQSGTLTSGALDRSKIKAANQIYGARPKNMVGSYAPDTGGASRFFYTGRPQEVYRWLGRLLSRP